MGLPGLGRQQGCSTVWNRAPHPDVWGCGAFSLEVFTILDLGTVCSQATNLAGGRLDWQLSEASFWCNAALQTVAQYAGHMPKEAIAVSSTTSGENRYGTPSDLDYPIAFTLYQGSSATTGSRMTTAIPLVGRDAGWADSRSLPDSGVPENYVFYSTYFELYPSPNSAYSLTLRYQSKQPTLIASTDTPALDDRWHLAWLFKTAEMLQASRNDVEGEAMARNRYLSYVAGVPTDRQLKQRDRASMTLRYTRNKLQDS